MNKIKGRILHLEEVINKIAEIGKGTYEEIQNLDSSKNS